MSFWSRENNVKQDSIASDCEPGVKLTNYVALSDDSNNELQQEAQILSLHELSRIDDRSSSSSSSSYSIRQKWSSANEKCPEFVDHANHDIMQYSQDEIDKQTSTVAGREQFVIIWRRLSFQVDVGLYDRLINRLDTALNRVGSQQRSKQQHNNLDTVNSGRKFSSSCKVTRVDTKRTIFENLNGFIKSGDLTAILGPSGVGKTSLLNAICSKADNYRGTVQLIGGGSRNMRLSIIPQKDYMIDNLTVKETLLYSSKTLNTEEEFDHEKHISNIVRMLNLADCFESSVSNISGGEYKRVSIAQELLKQPDLLILDEPTSGLDSLNCKNLIKSLAQLIDASRRGDINPIAIVMTIHQPDIEVFHMFDHVYCMARRGRVIYDGHPSDVMEVLNSQLKDLSKYEEFIGGQSFAINPSTLLIEITSENIYGQEVIEKLAEYQRAKFELEMSETNYENDLSPKQLHERPILNPKLSYLANPNMNSLQSVFTTNRIESSSPASNEKEKRLERLFVRDKRLNAKQDNHGKFWYHTRILARRAFKSTVRDFLMTTVSFAFHLLMPFAIWMIFSERIGSSKTCPILQRDLDMVSIMSNQTIEKIISLREELEFSTECAIALFLIPYSLSMCSIAVTSLAFPLNMHILLKEVRNGWYNVSSFVVAKTVANFPLEVMFPVMSFMLCYILLGLPPSYLQWRFWAMSATITLLSITSHTYGLIFGAIFMDSVETSVFVSVSSTLPFVLLSGFACRVATMPKYLHLISWVSPYRSTYNALCIIRFGYGICPCDDSTEDYLKTNQPYFSDIPDRTKSLFTYYMTNSVQDLQTTAETIGTTFHSMKHTSSNMIKNSTPTDIIRPFGISNEFIMTGTERNELISKIEANEIDPLRRLADLMMRSFSFGRELTTCDTVRSDVLKFLELPTDDYLPYILLGMVTLIVCLKIILFILIKYRIGKRI